MAMIVYILCAVTSGVCAFLLLRHYRRSRVKLLLWSGFCFICLGVSNVLLYVDLIMLPSVDLSVCRNLVALAGVTILTYGLISETT